MTHDQRNQVIDLNEDKPVNDYLKKLDKHAPETLGVCDWCLNAKATRADGMCDDCRKVVVEMDIKDGVCINCRDNAIVTSTYLCSRCEGLLKHLREVKE